MMRIIPLTQGKVARVSDHRYDELAKRGKWQAFFNDYKWYAVQARRDANGTMRLVYMHRVIMGITNPKILVDHWDGDGLNNQDENLRVATTAQNGANRGKSKRNTSGYKGVTWNKNRGKYQAQIEKTYLGLFVDPAEGARAYDKAAKEKYGPFAYLNFPEGTA